MDATPAIIGSTETSMSWKGEEKAAELARLEDFFGKLARGEHMSLCEQLKGRGNRESGSSQISAASAGSMGSSTEGSTSSLSAMSTAATSPASRISPLPDSTRDDGTATAQMTDEPTRGRTQTRTKAALIYTAQYPGGSFSSWQQQSQPVAAEQKGQEKREREKGHSSRFTFKMMLHELYEDIGSFKKMVKNVLEESKMQFRPLGRSSGHEGKKQPEKSDGMMPCADPEALEDRQVSGGSQRAAKKRRVRLHAHTGSVDIGAAGSDYEHKEGRWIAGSRARNLGETGCSDQRLRVDAGKALDTVTGPKMWTDVNGDLGSEVADGRCRETRRGGELEDSTPIGSKRRLPA